ncbi:DUF3427 domain-containing protein [Euzebya rosea]|uniref:DUF3427 domain-containing protein n=1 Tax=Euzebya rosea TaxID=2052804 RepID=UPI001F0C18CC|nr:DUF3427 domain-containing protein [Euzebya rosea]
MVRLADGTSAPLGPALLSLLETSTYDRVDLVVSFVMESGLKVIADPLADAVERGSQLRVLTTDYLYRTEPRALRLLHDLGTEYPGRVQLRVFESRGVRSFHPKGYLFHSSTDDQAAAWVGSSNLSASGLEGGIEWNVGLDTVRPMLETFEELWTHAWTVPLTERWIQEYQRHRPFSRTAPPPPGLLDPSTDVDLAAETTTPTDDSGIQELVPAGVDPADVTVEVAQPYTPRELQAEALAALEATRADGHRAGLVVMATGLGKTWLAAFDTARPQFGRVLFLAHREEILRQSLDVFRKVQPDRSLGMFMAQEREEDSDVVFASVQTLHRHLDEFEASDFDYVVVDEFHHAAASSYRKVIDHFDPAFLLGLTATPERMDGADLLGLCGDNLVYEANLVEGINRNELVPFEYHGIKDIVDFVPIPWRNGKFDPAMLSAAIETHDRAAHAHREWASRAGKRTLAFCQTTAHADFMAEWFRQQGLRTASVHSKPSSDPRRGSVRKLENGELDVLFAVDVFNEGFDLPAIDTVLMLRPTDSPVIFLQQLGRGLRLGDNKEKLVVVDFLGNHRSFLAKPRALLGLGMAETPSAANILAALEDGDWQLPAGCSVTWELGAVDLLRELATSRQRYEPGSTLVAYVQDHAEEFGERPTAMQALRSGYNPASAKRSHGGWFGLLRNESLLTEQETEAWDRFRSLVAEVEATSMTKSYKMVLLKALLHEGALHDGMDSHELAAASRRIVEADPRLVSDVQSSSLPDVSALTDEQWAVFWRKNPMAAWTGEFGKGQPAFRLEDDRFLPNFSVPEDLRDAVEAMLAELIEWRLGDYLLRRTPSRGHDIELTVSHSSGKPILRFDRTRNPEVPEGPTPFLADGERYVGNFVKIALNTAEVLGQQGNALWPLLRGWFGPNAGRPGTLHRVRLSQIDGEWVMRPIGAVAAGGGTALPFFPTYQVACGAFGQPTDLLVAGQAIEIADTRGEDRSPSEEFVVTAHGDSMAGGPDPVKSGDRLLMRWISGQDRAALVGRRVLVEYDAGEGPSAVLKTLDRTKDGFVLRSDNPSAPPISAASWMTLVAEYLRTLDQREYNPLARHLGEAFKRQDIPPLYGEEFNPGNWNTGHVSLDQDVLLFVTLHKGNMQEGGDYEDHLEGGDILVWSSQSSVGPDNKKGREILNAPSDGTRIHAWLRRRKSDVAFEYCGLVTPLDHRGAKPMSVRFRLSTPIQATSALLA